MFCKNCGKELSNNALLCPNCGEPVSSAAAKAVKQERVLSDHSQRLRGLSAVGMTLTLIAFVTGVIFGAFFFVFSLSQLLLFILGFTTILPAFFGLSMGIYALIRSTDDESGLAKTLSIVSIVFASVVLLFLFIAGCVIVAA